MDGGAGTGAPAGGGGRAVRVLAGAAFFALAVWVFRDALAGRRVFFTQDVLAYVEPKNAELLRALAERRFPLWLPAIGCGVPFFAEIDNATLNPFNLLLAFGPRRAIEIAAPLWCALAALFTHLLLREWRVARWAAWLGGLAYGLSGLLVFYHDNPPYLNASMWLPALLVAWHRAVARRSLAWTGLAGAVAALAVASGDMQTVYDGALLILPYGLAVVAAVAPRAGQGRARRLAPLALAVLLGAFTFALAAVQLLPTFELLREAPRKLDPETVYEASFHPARLLELVLPFAWGRGFEDSPYWGGFLHDARIPYPWTRSIYVGLVPLLVVPFAFAERRTRPLAVFAAAVGSVAVLASFGRVLPVYELLYRTLPFFDRFRVPSKLWVVTTLALAILGALGAERALARPRRVWAALVVAALALGGIGLARAPLAPIARASLAEAFLHAAAVAAAAGFLLASGGPGRLVPVALAALHALDLAAVNGQVRRWFGDPSLAPEAPVEAARLIAGAAGPRHPPLRIFHHEGLVEGRGWTPPPGLAPHERRKLWDRLSLDWNHAWRYGLEEVGGYTVLQDGRPQALRLALRAEPEALVRALGRLGVGFLLVAPGLDLPPGAREIGVAEGGAIRIARIEEPWPRLFLARLAREAGPADALAALLHPGFDPAEVVALEAPPDFPGIESASDLGTVEVTSYRAGRVTARVAVTEPRYLVFSEAGYSGWRARVDGVERPLHRANFLMQALALRASDREVVLEYVPRSFRTGLVVSAAAWIALAALVGRERLRPGSGA